MIKRILLLLPIFLLGACSSTPNLPDTSTPKQQQVTMLHPVTLTAVGYGAATSYNNYSAGQKRLMTMRASKLDAYRALAEQVYGVRITSNSTIAGLAVQHDSFRAYVDAYIRGAKVISVTPMADDNYETVLELGLNEQFYESVNRPQSQPFTQQQSKREQSPDATAGNNRFYRTKLQRQGGQNRRLRQCGKFLSRGIKLETLVSCLRCVPHRQRSDGTIH